MSHLEISSSAEVAIVALSRGKVNALNGSTVLELAGRLDELEKDDSVRGLLLTGKGKFFSFGFDIPEFLSFSKEAFIDFLVDFTNLYTKLYVYPKPVVAGLNGHTIAGGCMLALACDRRVMARGKGKISLNETTFGSSVFAGSIEMLKACAGHRNAETILYSGAMYGAEEALSLGLVDRVAAEEDLLDIAMEEALGLAHQDRAAFKSIKGLVRKPVAEAMRLREAESIREFADIWYSEATWEKLKKIEIRR